MTRTLEELLLEKLASRNPWERFEVARDPRASERVLLTALDDPDLYVRIAAARNVCATEAVWLKAARDPDPRVRAYLVQDNPLVSDAVRELLRHDRVPWVREAASCIG